MLSRRKPEPAVDRHVARLQVLGPVRSRAMFGGHGIFLDDRMFALVAAGRLYFKVDAQTIDRFEAAGGVPFLYDRRGTPVALGYRSVPIDPDEALDRWLAFAELALEAAVRTKAKRERRRR